MGHKSEQTTQERTRLRDFYTKEQCDSLFKAFDDYELVLSGKQMDWSDNLLHNYEQFGMAAYCTEAAKSFLDRQFQRLALERDGAP